MVDNSLNILEERIDYSFDDKSLLRLSLTHPSLLVSAPKSSENADYERLEFLGDRVLGLKIADMLFDCFKDEDEGSLARRHSALVCGDAIVEVAKSINLGDYLQLSDSELKNGGRENSSNLENSCEAVIGAIYKDGGIVPVFKFIESKWSALLKSYKVAPKDAKTSLQEWVQSKGLELPEYIEISRDGEAHSPVFEIEVIVGKNSDNEHKYTAKAGSKRKAEKLAAAGLIKKLGII